MNNNKLYMNVAKDYATLSFSTRLKVGAVIVRGDSIVSTGFNRVPIQYGTKCEDDNDVSFPYVIHAEQDAIGAAIRNKIDLSFSSIYITSSPCIQCAKMILTCGIQKVYYCNKYRDESGIEFLNKCGIPVQQIK